MNYNVTIHQKGIIEYNENHKGNEIDLIDAFILTGLYDFLQWQEIEKRTINEKNYYWVLYRDFLKQNPLLQIENDALYRRFKKLAKFKLIERKTIAIKEQNRKTYFRITELGYKTVTFSIENRNPYGAETATLTVLKPNNNNTINNITKDERVRAPLDFFKKKYSKEINRILINHKIQEKENCLKKFTINNDNRKVNLNDFEMYVMSWKTFEKESNVKQLNSNAPQFKRLNNK